MSFREISFPPPDFPISNKRCDTSVQRKESGSFWTVFFVAFSSKRLDKLQEATAACHHNWKLGSGRIMSRRMEAKLGEEEMESIKISRSSFRTSRCHDGDMGYKRMERSFSVFSLPHSRQLEPARNLHSEKSCVELTHFSSFSGFIMSPPPNARHTCTHLLFPNPYCHLFYRF